MSDGLRRSAPSATSTTSDSGIRRMMTTDQSTRDQMATLWLVVFGVKGESISLSKLYFMVRKGLCWEQPLGVICRRSFMGFLPFDRR